MKPNDIIAPQPAPRYRMSGLSMHDLASHLHELRGRHGWLKYASRLQVFNGRSSKIDKVQESLDRLVYELQELLEDTARDEAMAELRTWLSQRDEVSVADVLDLLDELFDERALRLRAEGLGAAMIRDNRVPDVDA